MNQPSLFGDTDEDSGKHAENVKEEDLITSSVKLREVAREYFPLPPETPLSRRKRRPVRRRERALAGRRGLVAKWSAEFGFISIHDPGSGDWVDIPTKKAPGWAKWEAHKRKQLYRSGDRHAYDLTRAHMEQLWRDEQPKDEGIVEEYPTEGEVGA